MAAARSVRRPPAVFAADVTANDQHGEWTPMPPGLEQAMNTMMPLKVALPTIADTTSEQIEAQSPFGANIPDESGEWVKAVTSIVPHLTQEGAMRALNILDRAIANAQQAKILEAAVANNAQLVPGTFLHAATEHMRVHLETNQQCLLGELQQVGIDCGVPFSIGAPATKYWHPGDQPQDVTATRSSDVLAERVLKDLIGIGDADAQSVPTKSLGGHNKARRGSGGGVGGADRTPVGRNGMVRAPGNPRGRGPVANDGSRHGAAPAAGAGTPNRRGGGGGHPEKRRSEARQAQTLSSSLQLLSGEDPDCLFIVRRINKLGFKAARILKRHFAKYGQVVRVLVAHSTMRQHGEPQAPTRRRPSSLGFVQMAAADPVKRILMLGDEQDVEGILIRVQRFERKDGDELVRGDAIAEEEADEDEVGDEAEGEFETSLAKDARTERLAKEIKVQSELDVHALAKDLDWTRACSHNSETSTATRSTCTSFASVETHSLSQRLDSDVSA